VKSLATFSAILFVCALTVPAAFAAQTAMPTKSLFVAIATGDVDEVKLHIARGADVNKPDANQNTPLGAAVDNCWSRPAPMSRRQAARICL
jgi:ankyrin repeat protein